MINNSLFKVQEVPNFHPIVEKYERLEWWREQKRRCIEGHWQSGKWMPPELYYYINFHYIEFEEGIHRGVGLPWLRDIDWEKAFIYTEATGFSGFELDEECSCNRKLINPNKDDILLFCTDRTSGELIPKYYNNFFKKDGSYKTYVPARDYLRKVHKGDLGKPLYLNESKHIIETASRGYGKSFTASGLILHNFLFDGARDYEDYLKLRQNDTPMSTETVVGAIDTKYSNKLIAKVRTALNRLPGSVNIEMGGDMKRFPSPLAINTEGSLAVGREFRATESNSIIQHVTFADNPLAANGGRPNRIFIDEVGFMNNLLETWEAIESTQTAAEFKRLTIYGLGTGGLTSGGAVTYVQEIFYDPETYGCLSFEDKWEGRDKSIGYFVPGTLALNKYKEGPNLITNEAKALAAIEKEREAAKKSKSNTRVLGTIINKPLVPSEIFLRAEGSFFPIHELKTTLADLERNQILLNASYKVDLKMEREGHVEAIPSDKKPITNYPLLKSDQMDACVELFEKPKRDSYGVVYPNRYILGNDPVDDDGNDNVRRSLQSTFVLDTLTERIVAEYTARTYLAEEYYENVRRLTMYYNGKLLYENNKKGLYAYFKNKNSLHLLADTPEVLRDQDLVKQIGIGNRSLGVNVSNDKIKLFAINLILKWLESPAYGLEDKKNVHTLRSIGLLKELISYSLDVNADRCLVKGTLINTFSGIKNIEDIKIGDRVLTKSGEYNEVYQIHKNPYKGEEVTIKVLGDFRELKCTSNHPIFINRRKKAPQGRNWMKHKYDFEDGKFVDAGDVRKNDFIFLPKRVNLQDSIFPEDLLYLMGWYLSDGWSSQRDNKIRIFLQEDQFEIGKDLENIINKYFKKERILVKGFTDKNGRVCPDYTSKKTNKAKLFKSKDANMWIVEVFSRDLTALLETHCGVPNNKILSSELYNSKNLMPLLKGFFEGDGHYRCEKRCDGVTRSSLELNSVYLNLILQIRQILIDNGIWNTLRKINPRKSNHKIQYNINISGDRSLPIIQNSKKFKQNNYFTNSQNFHIETSEGFLVPIKKVQKNQIKEEVYNISVKNDETYIANGILTHNCSALMVLFIYKEDITKLIESSKKLSVKTATDDEFWGRAFKQFNQRKVYRRALQVKNY